MEFVHVPVLLEESMTMLHLRSGGVYVDCTMGGAGHSREILERSAPAGRLVAIDQDSQAVSTGRARLAPYGQRATVVQANFASLGRVLDQLDIPQADGFLFDIGVSSHQLDESSRGFSYMADAPLDMRMDPQAGTRTAADLVNRCSEQELIRIISDFGEENWAVRIARFIVEYRQRGEIETTGQLVEIIKAAIPAAARKEGPHPAKRTFQALRIAVNDELGVLERAVQVAVDRLAVGGRICVITFHSLEDRIVKQLFQKMAKGCTCPPNFPVCVCGNAPQLKIITRKPVLPSAGEVEANPRARSAKLRVAEKL